MLHIVLADSPGTVMAQDRSYPNLGILYLIAYLREHLPDVKTTYLEGFMSLEEHVEKVSALNPDIYGLSFSYMNQRFALETLRAVRKECEDMTIVCGGPGPTAQYERVLQESPTDFCVIGEGEETFRDFVESCFLNDGDPSHIPGLAYKQEGRIIKTEARRLIKDLDSLPFPAWDVIDPLRYVGQHYQRSEFQSCLVISRGCPYKCSFCSNPVWRVSKPAVRLRSPQSIAEEAEYLYSRGVREIKFVSDEMNKIKRNQIEKAIHRLSAATSFFLCPADECFFDS